MNGQSMPAGTGDKAFATLRAEAALAGVTLHLCEGDDGKPEYVATRWALTRSFRSLDEVSEWLERVMGGAHGV